MKKQVDRKKPEKLRTGTICKINETYTISVDAYNYTLRTEGQCNTYHPCIENVLDEILNDKIKMECVANKKKDLVSVREAVMRVQKWMAEVVNPMLDMHIKQK